MTRVRRPVAMVLARFPVLTETFILREIAEMERQAQPVVLASLARDHPELVEEEARPWFERALFIPWMSPAIARSVLRALVQKPVTVVRLLLWLIFAAIFHPRTLLMSLAHFPKALHLAELFRSEGVGHIHAHDASRAATVARIASALSGISFSFSARGNDVYVDRSLLRANVREATFIRSTSQFNRNLLTALYPREARTKVHVIHAGIDMERSSSARAEGRAPRAGERLVSVGALEPQKGLLFLVEACRLLAAEGARFGCDIVGAGRMRNAIRRAVVKSGLHDRIRLHGELPQNQVAELIDSADIFILPSVIASDRRMDGIPVSLIEAMTAGKPVIATAVSGIPEVVADNMTGLLVDPGHPGALAAAIRTLTGDRALRERLARAGQDAVAEAFDLRRCAADLLELLDAHNRPAGEEVAAAVGARAAGAEHGRAEGAVSMSDRPSGGRTLRAAGWAFLTTGGTRLVTLTSLAVLARLLAPRDFGLLAFALVYITYAETVGDLGTAVALVYWPDRRNEASQVTFVMNVTMGLLWCAVTLALAPWIADFFRNPEAAPIVRVLAFGFLIKFLGNTHDALAQKDLRFRARMVPELGLAIVKAALSITLALAGFGAWSLVWGHMAGLTIWTIGTWVIVSWRPSLTFPRDLVAPMLRYGRGIVGVNVVAAISHHADLAIVGRTLGSTALGIYQLADRIPDSAVLVLVWVISKVLFPAFSRMRDESELRRGYLKALKYVSVATIPIATGLVVAAGPVVHVAFGPRWSAAAPVLQWLAVYVGVRSLGTHAGDILKATGRPGLLAWFGVFKAVFVVIVMILAAPYGLTAVAMSLALGTALTVVLNLAIVMHLLHFGWGAVARALRSSAIAGTALAIAALLAAGVMSGIRADVQLVTMALAGAAAYAITLYFLDRSVFLEISSAAPMLARRQA